MYHKIKEEITSQKIYSKSKNNATAKDKRHLLLFYFTEFDQGFFGWGTLFIFSWLIINYNHKCIQAETFETQVSWSLDLCTHKWHHSSPRLSYNDEEKVKKNIILARKINRNLSLINQHHNTMSSPENWKTFLFYKYVKYDTRWNATCAGF